MKRPSDRLSGQPVYWSTGAEGPYPGKDTSRVSVKSQQQQVRNCPECRIRNIRDVMKRNAEDLDSVQKCRPKMRRQGEWAANGRTGWLSCRGQGGQQQWQWEHPRWFRGTVKTIHANQSGGCSFELIHLKKDLPKTLEINVQQRIAVEM